MKIVDVSRATEIHRNTITALYNESAKRVEIEVIDKLCELFECEVGDMFERVKPDQ